MRVGTKSLLFGVHCFFIHPWFVAWAWWRLFGFPWDPRLWVAFIVHDWGYWGCATMNGPDGEWHPAAGAEIMHELFDARGIALPFDSRRLIARAFDTTFGDRHADAIGRPWSPFHTSWYCFVFYHSRYLAKHYSAPVSRLCYADKLSIALEPWWLYLPRAWASGELREYMASAKTWTASEPVTPTERSMAMGDARQWYTALQQYLVRWVDEHKDGKADTWTGAQR